MWVDAETKGSNQSTVSNKVNNNDFDFKLPMQNSFIRCTGKVTHFSYKKAPLGGK